MLAFSRRYKYYSNANNLSVKLFTEIKRRSSEWYVDLKRTMTLSTRIIDRPQAIFDSINKSTQFMSQVAEELPTLRSISTDGKLSGILQRTINDTLSELLVMKELKPLNNYLADSSDNGKPIVTAPVAIPVSVPLNPPQMMHNPNHNTRLVIR